MFLETSRNFVKIAIFFTIFRTFLKCLNLDVITFETLLIKKRDRANFQTSSMFILKKIKSKKIVTNKLKKNLLIKTIYNRTFELS